MISNLSFSEALSDLVVLVQGVVQPVPLLICVLSLQVGQLKGVNLPLEILQQQAPIMLAEKYLVTEQHLGLSQELAGLDPGARLVDEHGHPVAHVLHQLLHCNDALLPYNFCHTRQKLSSQQSSIAMMRSCQREHIKG